MAGDQIIDVIAVRHRFVSATVSVDVTAVMGAAIMLRSAGGGIGRGQTDGVLIDMSLMQVVQMTVVEVIDVIVVLDGGMTAASLMLMRMFGVGVAG